MFRMKGVLLAAGMLASACAMAQTNLLRVEIGSIRERNTIAQRTDMAVKKVAKRFADLTAQARSKSWRGKTPFSMPMRVELTEKGKVLPTPTRSKHADLALSFDSTFPAEYRQFLQDIYEAAKPTLVARYGQPVLGGAVSVVNYDSSIGDRDAIAGGYYVPNNGEGQRQIRFPIYLSREAAAVNFLHCVLLAFQGTTPYAFDAYQEGLVRAVIARVARTPGALPGADAEIIEQVLFNSYEVGGFYDWHNQRALGGSDFIAPNLVREALPLGGTYGGLYLLRYRMAGSVWAKMLAEYPSFPEQLNLRLAANPAIANSEALLISNSKAILQDLRGVPGEPTVEGVPFEDWVRRQYILEVDNTAGTKLMSQITPITTGLAGPDYGVFNVEVHYFRRETNGNETLLSGTCYPVFWDAAFNNRISTSAQDDRMDIAGAYGSVGPNFTDGLGAPYRVNIDLPVGDQVVRQYLPVGSIATASLVKPRTFYGTFAGRNLTLAGTYLVRAYLDVTAPPIAEATLTNYAFGALVTTDDFLRPRSLLIRVVHRSTTGVETTVLERRVNKGQGELALDLRADEFSSPFVSLGRGGIHAVGVPGEPLTSSAAKLLGITEADLLLARYNPSQAKYELYPDLGAFHSGQGFLLRSPGAVNRAVPGRRQLERGSWALKPGWNLVTVPFDTPVDITRALVMTGTGFPVSWTEATGTIVGANVFSFSVGAADASSGVPETGSFKGATGPLQPGMAYFVRCLSSQGALVSISGDASAAPIRSAAKAPAAKWQMKLDISGPAGSTDCFIATSGTAGAGFDAKEDSTLPPSFGGFQAKLAGTESLYRDVRRSGNQQIYTLKLDQLVPGKEYSIKMTPEIGYTNWVTLYDPTARTNFRPYKGNTYKFRAKKSVQEFRITVVGA